MPSHVTGAAPIVVMSRPYFHDDTDCGCGRCNVCLIREDMVKAASRSAAEQNGHAEGGGEGELPGEEETPCPVDETSDERAARWERRARRAEKAEREHRYWVRYWNRRANHLAKVT